MFFVEPSIDNLKNLINVSRGSDPADLYVRGGTIANVYSGEYLKANVAVKSGRIAYVGLGESCVGGETLVIDVSGKYVCPGYIEVHGHPFEIYNPVELCRKILPLGTATLFGDHYPFHLLLEEEDIAGIQAELSALPLKYFWETRIVPPSAMPDQIVRFSTDRIGRLLNLPNVAGICEIQRWTALLEGDRDFLERIALARAIGKRVDVHTPGCSYEKLNPVACTGVDSCHEAIDVQHALNRLRLGMYVFLRDCSLRKDLRPTGSPRNTPS